MKKKGYTTSKVQKAFNQAIVRRDKMCLIRDNTPCSGGLQCSHFFPVGGNSCLRFYPINAFAQCAGHHFTHHNRNALFYAQWIQENHPKELAFMCKVRGSPVKYSQIVLSDIYHLCIEDKLDELKTYIENMF